MFGRKKQKEEKVKSDVLDEQEVRSPEMEALYNETFRDLTEGQVVKGKIISISKTAVSVDIGYKSEGSIQLHEFSNASELKVGDEVSILLEALEDDEGRVVLSKRKADRVAGWDRIVEHCKEGSIVEGKIFKKVRGGLMVDIGMEAFMPASLVSLKPFRDLDQFIGQQLKFKIVKLNKRRKNIVLSRKDFLMEQRRSDRKQVLEGLKKGEVRKGRVKNITDFGAFVDLGGVDGLLHITDISWSRIGHPSEVVSVGSDIEIIILGIDKENEKVSLGFKQLTPNPWESVGKKYHVGDRIRGKVVNLMPYGAFIEVEKGIEGLAHISELSWTRHITHPSEILKVAAEVDVVILNVDPAAQKISLGLKQLEKDPWDDVESRYRVNQKIMGSIRNLTDYGAFVELEPGVDGLLHNSDMSWTRKVADPGGLFKKGEKIEVMILSVDRGSKKIALSLKHLKEDPWPEIVKRFKVGEKVKGEISKITSFGMFVRLQADCEGLIHISQIAESEVRELSKSYKVGQKIEARIIRIDEHQRRIGLSIKQL